MTPEKELMILDRVNKVKKELSRLSDLISKDEEFNNLHIRRMLERPPVSSSDEDDYSGPRRDLDHCETFAEEDEDELEQERIPAINLESSRTIQLGEDSVQNITKTTQQKEQETTAFVLKLQSELMCSSVETDQPIQYPRFKHDEKKPKRIESAKTGNIQTNFFMGSSGKVKSPKSTLQHKGSLKNISVKKSESHKDFKKTLTNSTSAIQQQRKKSSNKGIKSQIMYPQLSIMLENYKPGDDFKKQNVGGIHSGTLDSRNPKLNKITVNKFKENAKKSYDTQNQIQGLDQKLHLNLNERKPLMQRVLEKKNFLKEYNVQTKKYETCIREIEEDILMEELRWPSNQFPFREHIVTIMVRFVSQFSQRISKRILNSQINRVQFNFKEIVRDLGKVLHALPAKLFKNNLVSEQKYQQLIRNCDSLWSKMRQANVLDKIRRYKFVVLLDKLKNYIQFLFDNHLIETTERNNLFTNRRIMEYYSHRSDRDYQYRQAINSKPELAQNKRSSTKKKKPLTKGYETQRRLYGNDQNNHKFSFFFHNQIKKKNVNAFRDIQQNLKLQEKNVQLSTRSGKFKSPDQPRKGQVTKKQILNRK